MDYTIHEDEEQFPEECYICGNEFVDPIVTKWVFLDFMIFIELVSNIYLFGKTCVGKNSFPSLFLLETRFSKTITMLGIVESRSFILQMS